jgi:hypothetical protein
VKIITHRLLISLYLYGKKVKLYLQLLFLFFSILGFSQDSSLWVSFHPSVNQYLGFDSAKKSGNNSYYPTFHLNENKSWKSSYKILAEGKSDVVNVKIHGDTTLPISEIEFYFGKEKLELSSTENGYFINIKNPKVSNDLLAFHNGKKIGQLKTMVYAKKRKNVVVVPLISQKLDFTLIRQELVSVYKQANIDVNVSFSPKFDSKVFTNSTVFSSGDSLQNRYTGQMRLLRNLYFKENPNADKNAFYLFIIPRFSDDQKYGFMVPDKAIGFVPFQKNQKNLGVQIARTLAVGMGALNSAWIRSGNLLTKNLMDTTDGDELTYFQITELQRDMSTYSRLDAYETVKTGNGTIAYYFWEEDANGNIYIDGKSLVNVPRQPFKMNFLAYRFDVQYSLMRPLFRLGKYYISILNFIFITFLFFLIYLFRKRMRKIWEQKQWRNFYRHLLFLTFLSFTFVIMYSSFSWGNDILDQFKKVSGPVPSLKNLTYRDAKKVLFNDPEIRKQGEANLCSEILIRKNGGWEVKKRGQVLYFELKETDTSEVPTLRLSSTSDSLILIKDSIRAFARTHYVVYTRKSKEGKLISQDVYTYDGKKITDFQKHLNLPRRVLVFVNGYRPTSTGQTVGEGFKGIQDKGLEFPNSTNYIYNFDRYDYWLSWGEINLKFQNRINPSFTYYADGHFSVSTSNYKSLINFTRISQLYPLRCKNSKKHTCYTVKNDQLTRFILPTTKTEKLLKMNANKNGFEYRKKKGKIAGMNLLQEMNPYPNQSENDTLFIVAHSMGYAYALGMIEVLRDKINFGGFYIIAPENAKTGAVDPKEWQQIWQYGSRFNLIYSDAPCLQDGVAPQSGAKGLPFQNRVFIPTELYDRKGFFDSHFIGYYDWILKLNENEAGYMKQR